ncbi:TPA: DNA-binding response regulator [Candidatus Berkelbacteria bacterium]|uniref:Two component transcriptional regulator, winged helix family n=1 Tax=Berkelbacteria bacterium GW2011_GWE1_39_12 TaxID=1618337 RepID=A0A0G4B3B8_9BACT|nr:MAG: two component transcriptional regulator, winged helix family [Berkelbacteria bacterium GW2011_GWE1_39_12]HBO60925.1 DNA-binding response regulator [Candidatus Berkelbacteria bacterium]
MSKILIVEDDPVLSKMYAKKFEKDGFDVTSAYDGQEAVDKINGNKFDVVLLDIMLPKLDGFAVLKNIKENSKFKDLPVILSTNLGGGEQDKTKGEQMGAVDYLVKSDFTPSEIVEKVKAHIK